MALSTNERARSTSVGRLRLSDEERTHPPPPRWRLPALGALVAAASLAILVTAQKRASHGATDASAPSAPTSAPAMGDVGAGAASAKGVSSPAVPPRGAPLLAGGRVEAGRRAELSCGRAGVVAAIRVQRGVRVPSGTLLAELDNEVEKAGVEVRRAAVEALTARLVELREGARAEDLEAARGEVAGADAVWREAVARVDRDVVLSQKGALTPSQLLESQTGEAAARARLSQARARLALLEKGTRHTALTAAQAEVARARAELVQAEAALRATRLYAPFDGSMLEVRLNPGETFAPGMGPALLVFGDLDRLLIKADLPEAQATRVKVGDLATATVEALAPRTFPARVSELALEADRQKGTVEVTAELLEADPRIRPRMSARLAIVAQEE